MIKPDSLRGMRILITRPRGRAVKLIQALTRSGCEVVHFPVIEIAPPDNPEELKETLAQWKKYDLLIFISVPAVEGVAAGLREWGMDSDRDIPVAAIGRGTAEACARFGIRTDYCPDNQSAGMNSEGLLETLGDFNLKGKQVVIFRGQEGREKLKRELQNKGAVAAHVAAYRSRLTGESFSPAINRWREKGFDAVVITSVSILNGLITLLGESGRNLLQNTPVVTISNRIADICRQQGVTHIAVSKGPGDDEILRVLLSLKTS